MATLTIGGKTVVTQTGTDEPIIGSDVVFPAGHVLQANRYVSQESNNLTTSFDNYWEVSITLKSNNSKVIGIFTTISWVNSNYIALQIRSKNSANVSTSDTLIWDENSYDGSEPYLIGSGSANIFQNISINFEDSNPVGVTTYYGLFARKYNSNDGRLPPTGSSTPSSLQMILMEVQK